MHGYTENTQKKRFFFDQVFSIVVYHFRFLKEKRRNVILLQMGIKNALSVLLKLTKYDFKKSS